MSGYSGDYDYYDNDTYYYGLSGLLQAIAQAARNDKEDIRRSYSRVFGEIVGHWLSQVHIPRRDPRSKILSRILLRNMYKEWLRGRWSPDNPIVLSPDAVALMLELAEEYTFQTYNLPEKLPLTQRILRGLRVER